MIFKQEEQVVGVEAELAEALGRELGRKVEFVELKKQKAQANGELKRILQRWMPGL